MNVPLRRRFLSCLSRLLCCLVFSLAALVCLASCPGVGTPANSDSNPYGTPSGGGSSGTGSGGSGSSAGGTSGTVSGGNSGGTISGTSSGTGGRMFSPGNLLDAANAGDVNQLLNLIGTANASGDIFSSETEAVEFDAADLSVPAGGSVTLTITGGSRKYTEKAPVDADGKLHFQVPRIAADTSVTVEMVIQNAAGRTVGAGSCTQPVSEGSCEFSFDLKYIEPAVLTGNDINSILLSLGAAASAGSFGPSALPPPAGVTTAALSEDGMLVAWLDGGSIRYYAKGYTDSGRKIPMAADASNMFAGCSSLASLDLSGFDTGAVTDMSFMFQSCSALADLNLGSFDTGRVTDMSNMFENCSMLSSLSLSSFNTGCVTNMNSMFYGCSGLSGLDLSGFDTGRVEDMNGMFYGCNSMTSLNLSGLATGAVRDMAGMFSGCASLSVLNLGSFNTAAVTRMATMFSSCSSLTTIYVSPAFVVTALTDSGTNMFFNCSSLSSGVWDYDVTETDAEMAHIGTDDEFGYFTAVP